MAISNHLHFFQPFVKYGLILYILCKYVFNLVCLRHPLLRELKSCGFLNPNLGILVTGNCKTPLFDFFKNIFFFFNNFKRVVQNKCSCDFFILNILSTNFNNKSNQKIVEKIDFLRAVIWAIFILEISVDRIEPDSLL